MKNNQTVSLPMDFVGCRLSKVSGLARLLGATLLPVFVAITAAAGSFPCSNAVPGLVTWWAAEGNASDAVGTNSGALVNGAGFAEGEVGQAFIFNGSNQCVTVPYSPSLVTSNFTVEAWVKPLGPVNNWLGQDVIMGQSYGAWQLLVRPGGSGLRVAVQIGTSWLSFYDVVDTAEIPVGQFSHLAGTWDGTTLRLYVNGALKASREPGVTPVDSQYPISIGGFRIVQGGSVTYSDQYFKGLIDEASYYNRALAGSELLALYQAGPAGKCGTPMAPTIQTGPRSQTVAAGASVTMTVAASGAAPLHYQWHLDGANLAGATKSALVLTNAQAANAGTYDVLVTNAYGSTNSLEATLRVLAAPRITGEPADQRVGIGSNATFTVTATGAEVLSYQWYFNGTPVSGATTASFAINGVGASDAGSYRVSVSNEVGVALSRIAVLSLDMESVCIAPPAGLVSWWAAQGDATDEVTGNSGALVNGAGFAEGEVGQAFIFNGSNQCVTVPYSPSLVTSNFTVEAWVKPLGPVNNWLGQDVIMGQSYGAWQLLVRPGGSGLRVAVQIGTSWLSFYDVVDTAEIPVGQFSHLAGTWDGTTLRLYVNGALKASREPGVTPVDSQYPISIGGFRIVQGGSVTYSDQYFKGLIDEASYYNRALAGSEVTALYNARSAGKCATPMAPMIQAEPSSRTVAVGGTTTLTVAASGTGPLRYQWHHDGADIAGATKATLVWTNVQAADAGTYDVLVTNLYGITNSLGATLTVLNAPRITGEPADQTTSAGSNVTFAVEASGDGPLSYQWYFEEAPVNGATNASLELSGVSPGQAGGYRVSVSNLVGVAYSRTALLFLQSDSSCIAAPAGLISWWRAGGDAADAAGTNNGVLNNGAGFTVGEVGPGFKFDGLEQCVTIPYSTSLVASNFSVEAWVKPQGPVINGLGQNLIIGQAFGAWQLVVRRGNSGVWVAFQVGTRSTDFHELLSASEIPLGQFTHMVGTWDGTTLRLYINGALSASTVPGVSPKDSQFPVYIGGFYIQDGANVTYSDQYFNGVIDEPSYYGRALNESEIQGLYGAASGGKCNTGPLPAVVTQSLGRINPADLAVVSPLCHIELRDDGSVRVTCSGSPGKTYLFQKRTSFLSEWIDSASIKADSSGACEYIDHPQTNAPARYYRALLR